jgi:hypothetical protein
VCRSVLTRRGMPFGGAAHHRIARVPSPHSFIFPFAKALARASSPLIHTCRGDPVSNHDSSTIGWMQKKKDASSIRRGSSFLSSKIIVHWSF